MENLYRDIRYGLRTLAKSPGFTIVATLILALGIGATTAIFTLVNGIFLKPLPLPNAEGLISVYTTDEKNPGFLSVSGENYRDFRDENEVFSNLVAYTLMIFNIGTQDEPAQALGEIVTGNYFETLALTPALGRLIQPDDDEIPGASPVVVLSYKTWQSRFGSDPGVLGTEIRVNGTPLTIIGVAEQGFEGLTFGVSQEVWVPSMMYRQVHPTPDLVWGERRAIVFNVVGRLKPDVTLQQAESNMQAIASALEEQYPEPNEGRNVTLDPLSRLNPGFRSTMALAGALLIAISGLVLAIASANIANLLLVRATARKREIAVRLSLGAGRVRLIRQLLTESFVLSAIGGIGGLLIAVWVRDLIWSLAPPLPFQISMDMSLDARVLGFAGFISVLGGLFFGLVPAIQASRPDLSTELKSGQQREGSIRRFSPRNILVVAQVSLSLIALISAGLLMRSFQNTLLIEPGFRTDNVLTATLGMTDNRYLEEATGQDFYRRLQEEIEAIPGVVSADLGTHMPMFFGGFSRTVFIEGRDAGEAEDGILVGTSTVGPKYLETMGISLLRGRDFSRVEPKTTGTSVGPDYVIINETMADRFWPGENALGRRFTFYGDEAPVEIIGIAANAKYNQLAEQPQPYAYLPLLQSYRDAKVVMNLFVNTQGTPTSVAGDVRTIIRRLDPNLPITGMAPMGEMLNRSMWLPRIGAWLVAVFGGLALFLAGIGVYGVISFSVSQRTHEIGLRMALGARSADAMKLVVKQGLTLSVIGIVIGVLVSIALTRVMATFLVGIDALDPTVFGGVALTLAAVSMLASYIPALRATKVDPVTALRFE